MFSVVESYLNHLVEFRQENFHCLMKMIKTVNGWYRHQRAPLSQSIFSNFPWKKAKHVGKIFENTLNFCPKVGTQLDQFRIPLSFKSYLCVSENIAWNSGIDKNQIPSKKFLRSQLHSRMKFRTELLKNSGRIWH